MTSGFDIEPGSLRSAGKGVADAAHSLSDTWHALKASSDGMGDIFGDDMVGGLIGASYGAASDIADDSFTSTSKGYQKIADGLGAMADMYDDTEQDTADSFGGRAE